MKLRLKIFIAFLVSLIPAIVIGIIAFIQLSKIAEPLKQDIPQNLAAISKSSRLDSLASLIRYYDEVLTQSARNYAFTGDKKWKERYDDNVPKLDEVISEAIKEGDAKDKQFFNEINEANLALVKMEESALTLVDKNKKAEAVKILESADYAKQKDIYKNGLIEYVQRKGQNLDEAISTSTQTLSALVNKSTSLIQDSIFLILLVLSIGLLLLFLLSFYISYRLSSPLVKLKNIAREISSGNLTKRIDITSQDEIGELGKAFNYMSDSLKESKENIEQKVVERTKDLERLNKLMVDRELKMIELKQDLNKLQNQKNK